MYDYRIYTYKSEVDKAMHTLEGILKGIAIDNVINEKEASELKAWRQHYEALVDRHPFKELIPVAAKALEDNVLDSEELKDLLWLCRNFTTENIYYDIITSDIQKLEGILHGTLADNVITEEEVSGLNDWLEENTHLTGVYPYDEIYSIVSSVLVDGILSNDEKKLLKAFFSEFVETNISVNIDKEELARTKNEINIGGICAFCPTISIPGKTFCFTGASSKTTRSTIKDTVESVGGIFKNNVSKLTDYLVVGNDGNPCWAFACYGRKIEAAMNLRKGGNHILIVHENDFWDSLEDFVSANR